MPLLDRRQFVKAAGAGFGAVVTGPRAAWPDERAMARAAAATDSFVLLRREQQRRRGELPAAADFHRLPLTWYQAKAKAIKEEARRRGVDGGVLLTRTLNIIYVTGLFHTNTERPFACFLPLDDDEALIWFNPYLDQQLVREWWSTGSHAYFDYHHADGGFPNDGKVAQGNTVNIYRWWGETLAKLGLGSKTIAVDAAGGPEAGVLPGQDTTARLDMLGRIDVPQKMGKG